MFINVRKITDLDLLKEILEFVYDIDESKMSLATAYLNEHSIIRSQLFLIKMKDIPTKASVHFVRHSAVGQLHVVSTNRKDLNDGAEDESINRLTPVNHVMLLNGQHLIEMARKRLCSKAEDTTRSLMDTIRQAIGTIDPDLAAHMVPNCFYRGGICPEPKGCGLNLKFGEETR